MRIPRESHENPVKILRGEYQRNKTEVLKTRKVEDRWEEDCKKRDYLGYMNLREARVWIQEQNDCRSESEQILNAEE